MIEQDADHAAIWDGGPVLSILTLAFMAALLAPLLQVEFSLPVWAACVLAGLICVPIVWTIAPPTRLTIRDGLLVERSRFRTVVVHVCDVQYVDVIHRFKAVDQLRVHSREAIFHVSVARHTEAFRRTLGQVLTAEFPDLETRLRQRAANALQISQ